VLAFRVSAGAIALVPLDAIGGTHGLILHTQDAYPAPPDTSSRPRMQAVPSGADRLTNVYICS
jgi:hypothetical protein